MKRFFIPIISFLFFSACHSRPPEITAPHTDTARKNYLPVADYLKAEIAAVDSFPLRIMKYHNERGYTDSVIINTTTFDQLARQFLLPELDSSRFEKKFEENSFVDRSTDLVSFTYATKDTGTGLKRVDVLLKPGANINKLSSVYMEAIANAGDTTLIRKLSWKAGRNFSILQIRKPVNGPEAASQTLVVWDSRD